MIRKISLWTHYNIKTFRASLKVFPSHHLVKATLETISVIFCSFYNKKTIIHIYIYKQLKHENNIV